MKENFQLYEKMKNEAIADEAGAAAPDDGLVSAPEDGRGVAARISAVYDDLTESEKRLAEVVLEAAADLFAFTAGELANRADVSAATAARFFRRLGYDSYADVRRAARDGRSWGSPLYELDSRRQTEDEGFAQFVAQDVANLNRTVEQLAPDALAAAVGHLVSARRVVILGFRNSSALATYARGLLAHVRPDVRLLPLAGQTLAEDLVGIGPDDTLLVFGFRRRPPVLRDLLALAKEAGTPTVLITDATAARSAHLATVTLRCQSRGQSLFDSYVAPMSLTNYLCAAVQAALGPAAEERLAAIERLHHRFDPFVVPGRSR